MCTVQSRSLKANIINGFTVLVLSISLLMLRELVLEVLGHKLKVLANFGDVFGSKSLQGRL